MARLTLAQRGVLADGVRAALVGWLLACPVAGPRCRALQAGATTVLGFSFSRFATAAAGRLGRDWRPRSPGPGGAFPLSIAEACALANDVELDLATDDQLHAAALLAAHAPFAQPRVGSPDWRQYLALLDRLGVDPLDGDLAWRQRVRDRLRPFLQAVAEG